MLEVLRVDESQAEPVPEPQNFIGRVRMQNFARSAGATNIEALAVFFDAIVRLVSETPVADVRFSAWPIAARERFLSRALGRVIAHEIGHYLLGPRHSSGLMRRAFSAADLVDRSSARFRLSALDVQRLPRADAAAAQH